MTVFEDDRATTCPDCEGDLEYQSDVVVTCVDCGESFDHFYTTDRNELCTTAEDGTTLEVVASEPRDDQELRADGGSDTYSNGTERETSPPLSDSDPWKVGQPDDGIVWLYKSSVDGFWRIIKDEDHALEEATGYPVGELLEYERFDGDTDDQEAGELRAISVPPAESNEPEKDGTQRVDEPVCDRCGMPAKVKSEGEDIIAACACTELFVDDLSSVPTWDNRSLQPATDRSEGGQ